MKVEEDRRFQQQDSSAILIAEPTMGESAGLAVRLLVSPAAGRLRLLPAARFHSGEEWVSPGQTVALVERGAAVLEVKAPSEARVAGVLVRDGEPVAQGQPLVWLDEVPRWAPSRDDRKSSP